MMVNYYPWKVQDLGNWLRLEIATGKSLQDLAEGLQIPRHILNEWLSVSSPFTWSTITQDQIEGIAYYRGWSFRKTLEWLGVGSAHLEELSKIH